MSKRCLVIAPLGLALLLASGCPEPGEEGGQEWGDWETGETGGTGRAGGDGDGDTGVETGGDVRPPLDAGDDDDTGDGDGDPGDGDGDGDGGGSWDPDDRCWDRTWSGDELPAVILDNTVGRNDDFTGSCGLGPAPDFQLGFQAPWSGRFTFDTAGSSFDTVLYIDAGQCGVQELGCNDDFINFESRLSLDLDEGEIVTVTVDGAGPFEEGQLQLTISEAVELACDPQMIIPNLPQHIVGDTTNAPNELASGCGGAGAPEKVHQFIAPGPGTYRFDTAGSSFDTVLYPVVACDSAPLTCNDDANFELTSELTLELNGGQKLLFVVDGRSPGDFGEYMLNVQKL